MLETVALLVSLAAGTTALVLSWLRSKAMKAIEENPAEFAGYIICELEDPWYLEQLGMLLSLRMAYGAPIPLEEGPTLRG